jgi:hypothetical protein
VTSVVLPTLTIAASWLLFAIVLLGVGYLVRLVLLRWFAREPRSEHPQAADLWLGLAAIVLYLLVWNDVAPVDWLTWIAPVAAGAAGLVAGAPRLRVLRGRRLSAVPIVLAGLAALYLANQALAVAGDYDFGLYHLGLIHYSEHYSAIPGLANLQSRFGAGDGHLLFVAFLDHGPWAGAGPHLADGLLAMLLCIELASRFAFRPVAGGLASFTNRMALLLVPALVIVVVWRPDQRIASPNLDFAAFVLVAVGLLYLAEAVERGFQATAVATSAAALATASATRPLYWVATLFAIAVAASAAGRAGWLRAAGLAGLLPAATALAWMGRQTVLSGYPLFPTTTFRLGVDWRVPLTVVSNQNDWDHAWARWPGNTPAFVLGSWHWLRAFWLQHAAENPDVALPLLLLAVLPPALLLARRGGGRSARTRPMLAVVVPSLFTLVEWFFIAPDPRFAWAPIWLVPIGLTAWAIPDLKTRPSPWLLLPVGIATVLVVELATLSGGVSGWLVPGAISAVLLAAIVAAALHAGARAGSIAVGVAVTALIAGVVVVSDVRGLDLRRATKGGPLGTPPDPTPSLVDVTTTTGLVVRKPAGGADQCWQAILCVPQLKVKALAMRGPSIGDGFQAAPRTTASLRN